jgi:hypothetical protein
MTDAVSQPFVITCGDEGVQINVGRRLGFVGAGFRLEGFDQVVPVLNKLFGETMAICSSEENDWAKQKLSLVEWGQVNASMQQHIEALADQLKINYAGYLPFSDPKQLKHDVKGHMVRPHKVHIANKISFTCGGGEQIYNLGNYVISADWVHLVPKKLAKALITDQVAFYQSLAGKTQLNFVFETNGVLGEKIALKNQKIVESVL